MMNHATQISLIGFGIALACVPAMAELHLEAGGGIYIPAGDSARFNENGYRIGAGIEYGFTPNVALLLSGSYNRNNVNASEVTDALPAQLQAGAEVDGHAQIIELTISPKFYLRNDDDLGVFLLAGAGPRWIDRKTTITRPTPPTEIVRESNQRSIGVQLGFGVEAAISKSLKIGLSPLYHQVFTKGDSKVRYVALTAYLKI